MSPTLEECRQILGVNADASAETIRQAYLDLVRVWHPDRFQSDERLRQIADDNVCKINLAYAALKNGPSSGEGQSRRATGEKRAPASPDTAPRPEASQPRTAPPPFRRAVRRRQVPPRLAIAICCVVPVWAIAQSWMLLRVPALDAGPIFRPRILEPMRFIDPSLGTQRGSAVLVAWANGDLMDLWKPVPANEPPAPSGARKPAARVRAQPVKHSGVPPEPEVAPANGADLINPTRLGGQGDLLLTNQTGLEAVVRLVSGNGATARAIYIGSEESARMRAIGIGVYTVHVELGRNLDVRHLSFRSESSTPDPIGPFQFVEITSDDGVSGSHFTVVLKPRPQLP